MTEQMQIVILKYNSNCVKVMNYCFYYPFIMMPLHSEVEEKQYTPKRDICNLTSWRHANPQHIKLHQVLLCCLLQLGGIFYLLTFSHCLIPITHQSTPDPPFKPPGNLLLTQKYNRIILYCAIMGNVGCSSSKGMGKWTHADTHRGKKHKIIKIRTRDRTVREKVAA
ncbi:hypothetical protein ATANTOWER_025756 [Ataeniobius toweri]|uniref:Uncharacterized protein n=1 Tax=Ataeniobius toweri TaxID=208326 RepID=A0ABU7C469_9TELE|nr:hypothetical protein [Ataeniobius toweri]